MTFIQKIRHFEEHYFIFRRPVASTTTWRLTILQFEQKNLIIYAAFYLSFT